MLVNPATFKAHKLMVTITTFSMGTVALPKAVKITGKSGNLTIETKEVMWMIAIKWEGVYWDVWVCWSLVLVFTLYIRELFLSALKKLMSMLKV